MLSGIPVLVLSEHECDVASLQPHVLVRGGDDDAEGGVRGAVVAGVGALLSAKIIRSVIYSKFFSRRKYFSTERSNFLNMDFKHSIFEVINLFFNVEGQIKLDKFKTRSVEKW